MEYTDTIYDLVSEYTNVGTILSEADISLKQLEGARITITDWGLSIKYGTKSLFIGSNHLF